MGHYRVSSVDGLGHMEAYVKNRAQSSSLTGKSQRQGNRARHRDRARAPNRSPRLEGALDIGGSGKLDKPIRPRIPLQEMGNRTQSEASSPWARSHGSGTPSVSGRGSMFASSLSNRGPHMVMSDAAMDIALKRQRDAAAVFSPRCCHIIQSLQFTTYGTMVRMGGRHLPYHSLDKGFGVNLHVC